jgi:hypothetical protein
MPQQHGRAILICQVAIVSAGKVQIAKRRKLMVVPDFEGVLLVKRSSRSRQMMKADLHRRYELDHAKLHYW